MRSTHFNLLSMKSHHACRLFFVFFAMTMLFIIISLFTLEPACYELKCGSFTRNKTTIDDLDCETYSSNLFCLAYNCTQCLSLESNTHCYAKEHKSTCKHMGLVSIVFICIASVCCLLMICTTCIQRTPVSVEGQNNVPIQAEVVIEGVQVNPGEMEMHEEDIQILILHNPNKCIYSQPKRLISMCLVQFMDIAQHI